jgi:recombination protein RecT
MSNTAIQKRPVDRLKSVLAADTVQQQFRNALGKHSDAFVASLVDLYGSDSQLQECEPADVIREAFKAATLQLPINKSLGFAWIVARYNGKLRRKMPAFQPGWKGIVQLAQRTAKYRYINCGPVYEGEFQGFDKLTGALDINGEAVSDKVVGYFAYIELLSGFSKASYWTIEQVKAHVLRYNPESKKAGKISGNWSEHFDSRAMSTVLKHLISKYGVMTVETAQHIAPDEPEEAPQAIADREANQEILDIEPEPQAPISDAEAAEIQKQEVAEAGPDF